MLRSVDFRCKKEITAQFEGKQRPNIAVYNYCDCLLPSKKLLLDITVTHPWSKTNLSGSSKTAGLAATAKEKEKNTKYLTKASNLGHLY